MKLEEFIARLGPTAAPKRTSSGWMVRCPAHADKNPSLSVAEGKDGRILLKCHAGCTNEAVCAAVGLKVADLMPDDEGKAAKRIVATYPYRAEDGTLLFEVVRYDPKDFRQRRPDPTGKDGWAWNLKGVRRVPYRLPELLAAVDSQRPVFIAEGERDVLALVQAGFVATCNPGGADKWLPEFSQYLRGAEVVILPDKDGPGRKHAQNVAEKLHGIAGSIRVVELPDLDGKPVKDAADFFAGGGAAADLDELVNVAPFWSLPVLDVRGRGISRASEYLPDPQEAEPPGGAVREPPRVAKVSAPTESVSIGEWRTVIDKNFPTLRRAAEICVSVVAQLLIKDVTNPFALALVDVPASGKTITLNFFTLSELIYTTDSFTPAAFVSHASNVKREELGRVDLLPRIRFKTLIVRDLAPIFGAKDDDLVKSLGILTRVLDGEGLEIDSGVHGQRGYKGDYLFMLLAGTPPIPPRVFKVMGNLGSRLFFLSLSSQDKSEAELVAQNRETSRTHKEILCRDATSAMLCGLWAKHPSGVEWNRHSDPDEYLRVIARCAKLLAALRGTINVWHSEHDDRLSHNVPVIEKPDRINCLFYNLARGHALVCGRRQISAADMGPILDVTFDSAPTVRAKVFRGLLEGGGTLGTGQVERLLRCSKPTALKEMEALAVLGVADKTEAAHEFGRPEQQIALAPSFAWFLSGECRALQWARTDTQGGNP